MTRTPPSRRPRILATLTFAGTLLGALATGSLASAHCVEPPPTDEQTDTTDTDITGIDYEFLDGAAWHTLSLAIDDAGLVTARLGADGDGDGEQVELVGQLDPAAWEQLTTLVAERTAAFVDCPPDAPMTSVRLTTAAGSELASWCAADEDPIILELAAAIRHLLTS